MKTTISVLPYLLPALLLIFTVIQATYPEKTYVKSKFFRRITTIIAVLSAILMMKTAMEGGKAQESIQKTQEELSDAYKGISQTVFQQDIGFEFLGIYSPPIQPVTEFEKSIVTIYVIPKESPFFCKWQPTHTPNPFISAGKTFDNAIQPTSDDEMLQLIGAPGIQLFTFELSTPVSGNEIQYSERFAHPTNAISTRNVTLNEYRESQFLCEIGTPGTFHKVWYPQLLIKGQKVAFNMIKTAGRHWIGNTVFRPTWERYCRHKD